MKLRPVVFLGALVLLAGCRDRSRPQKTTTTSASATAAKEAELDTGGAELRGSDVVFPIGASVPAGYDAKVEAGSDPDTWIVMTRRYELNVWRAGADDPTTPDAATTKY